MLCWSAGVHRSSADAVELDPPGVLLHWNASQRKHCILPGTASASALCNRVQFNHVPVEAVFFHFSSCVTHSSLLMWEMLRRGWRRCRRPWRRSTCVTAAPLPLVWRICCRTLLWVCFTLCADDLEKLNSNASVCFCVQLSVEIVYCNIATLMSQYCSTTGEINHIYKANFLMVIVT